MKNKILFEAAKKVIPGGVNSPVRAFKAVGGSPIFIKRARGPYLYSEEGKRYIDFIGSWGPMLLGHAPRGLIQAVSKKIKDGTSFGAPTKEETYLAELIREFFPMAQKVRLTNSGTEAVMSAVRLARGYTGRSRIVKIDGGYHGHVDSLLIQAGSGATTFGVPDSKGIPSDLSHLSVSVPFNNIAALERVFKKAGKEIAAFILEPVPGNMGTVLPDEGYLEAARSITKKYGALLIFDEVMTGFRITEGGAQKFYGVKPDLTVLGKIVGGGMPLAAFGGRAEIMNFLAPLGPVYQAGTLAGNPAAVSAALWMLTEIKKIKPHAHLHRRCAKFYFNLHQFIRIRKIPVTLNHIGSMWTLFFTQKPVTDYVSAKYSDTRAYARFFNRCLSRGLYLAPAQFEANFISTTHSESVLNQASKVICDSLT
ncbi:MAG TPA: glutamate-1-semialdehyde-2,1-aminomutase [Candidatus Omnitrophica bacterium]|nr:glutamate-1-semialdehyde-2,1-aminomutase [Candidatus Omnitrophota bacterium]